MSQLTWWILFQLVIAAAVAYAGGWLVSKLLRRALFRVAVLSGPSGDERIIVRMASPLAAIAAVVLWQVGTTLFGLPRDVLAFARAAGSIGVLVALAWSGLRAADVATEMIAMRSSWIGAHRASQSLLPIARRLAKAVWCVLVAVIMLSELGYAVGPLIVGLGVTGIAIALAAQKTLENVFGAFAIGADQLFREGDLIKLDELVATVETIGLRSTRLRTPDGTLVTIPNGKLADTKIEALAAAPPARSHGALSRQTGTMS
jgi:MscS family membrane protein